METIYNFCDNCDNVMYVYLDKNVESEQYEAPKLYLYCKKCQNKQEYRGNLLYNNDHYVDLSESINSNKFINYDITLPHIKSDNIKCPNSECVSITEGKKSDIIYIKYDKDNMKYIYSCNYCSQKWTNN
jgi:DNA-directed RNA polymerase subunit M/transcription elongation factor TFIIS